MVTGSVLLDRIKERTEIGWADAEPPRENLQEGKGQWDATGMDIGVEGAPQRTGLLSEARCMTGRVRTGERTPGTGAMELSLKKKVGSAQSEVRNVRAGPSGSVG